MKNKLTLFTKWLLDFMYYAGILTTVLVPVIIYFYGKYNPYFSIHILSLSVIFMLSGILAVLIIRELRRLFLSVLNDNCFIHENVRSLNRMGTYSFFIALITCCRLFLDCRTVQQSALSGLRPGSHLQARKRPDHIKAPGTLFPINERR